MWYVCDVLYAVLYVCDVLYAVLYVRVGCFVVVFIVCHDHIRRRVSQGSRCRGSQMHELIPPDFAIDPLVTSPSDVRCMRTSVSRLVVQLHIHIRQIVYRCRMVRRIPYAYSPAVVGSVVVCHDQVRRQVSQDFRCRDS